MAQIDRKTLTEGWIRHIVGGIDEHLDELIYMSDPNLRGTILRCPMVHGPRDRQHRVFEYLKRMGDRRRAILLEEGQAAWRWAKGYVENLATVVVLAVTYERAAGRICNVGEGETLTWAEWVRAIGRAAGWMGRFGISEEKGARHRQRNVARTCLALA